MNRSTLFNSGIGIFILRLFIGVRLIYGTIDNVFSWDRMLEFRDFLAAQGFPMPHVCAVVSVYAQFICGIMILIGFKIRWAAAIMIFNFFVAVGLHLSIKDGFEAMTPPYAILFSCILFFLEGAGRFGVDTQVKIQTE